MVHLCKQRGRGDIPPALLHAVKLWFWFKIITSKLHRIASPCNRNAWNNYVLYCWTSHAASVCTNGTRLQLTSAQPDRFPDPMLMNHMYKTFAPCVVADRTKAAKASSICRHTAYKQHETSKASMHLLSIIPEKSRYAQWPHFSQFLPHILRLKCD